MTGSQPAPADPVTAIQFYIPSSTQAVGFNFCIGDLTALY
jgi:hypothetical protein